MDWRSPRTRLIAVALIAVALLGWFLWWRSPGVQAPRTFALLQQAFADGKAGNVLDQVHPDYTFSTHWPTVPWAELGQDESRTLAARGLMAVFFMHRENPLSLAVDIQSVTPGADGRTTVVATLQLTSQQGTLPFQLGPIRRHRFVLAPDSWTGHLSIIDHDPIEFQR